MSPCSHCGAAVPAGAAWCGQCYQPIGVGQTAIQPAPAPPPAAPTPVSAPAVPVRAPAAPLLYAGSDRFGLAPVAAAAAPSPAGEAGVVGPAGLTRPLPPPPTSPPPTLPPAPGTWVPSQPAGIPAYTEENARRDGRLLDRRALRLVAIAIGLGGVMQIAGILIGKDTNLEPSVLIGIDIVMTLAFYGVVGGLVVSQITPNIRLRWGDGSLVVRLLTGLVLGAGLSGVLLFLVSTAVGHLSPDPRFLLLMSEGDPTHIALVVLITCVAAPLVEETLFRGLLLESLLPRGKGLAIVCSALAFAIWHFIPSALVYYGVMGAGFAAIYIKRGLATSMAAHVGFNGVLTVAAITIVLAPAHVVSTGTLSFTAPEGWSSATPATAEASSSAPLDLHGPSGAEVVVLPLVTPGTLTADEIQARLQDDDGILSSSLGGPATDPHEVELPIGTAVEVDIDIRGHHGDAVLIPEAGGGFEAVFLSAGSVKATEDFDRMLDSMQLS